MGSAVVGAHAEWMEYGGACWGMDVLGGEEVLNGKAECIRQRHYLVMGDYATKVVT